MTEPVTAKVRMSPASRAKPVTSTGDCAGAVSLRAVDPSGMPARTGLEDPATVNERVPADALPTDIITAHMARSAVAFITSSESRLLGKSRIASLAIRGVSSVTLSGCAGVFDRASEAIRLAERSAALVALLAG